MLLKKFKPGTDADGRWMVLTPILSVEPRDISAVRIMVLTRGVPMPSSVATSVHTFAVEPTVAELQVHHAHAVTSAALFSADGGAGMACSTGPPASWRVCHTGSPIFGDTVSDEQVTAGGALVRGAMGLCEVDGTWWPVERVPDAEYAAWRNYMLNGPHRDERLAGMVVDTSGRRFVGLHDYLALLRPVDRSKQKDYPHRGPSAAVETLHGVRGSGRELIAYDEMWSGQSGIHPHSAIRAEHRTIFHTLAMMQSWDQIDIPATAAGEYLCRRALQIQRAVAANPRAPSFIGLSKMIEHALDERAGLATLEFTQHFATVAEADARILKQNRLLRAELAAQGPTPLLPIADGDDDDAVPAPSARSKKRAAKAAAKKK